MNESLDFIYTMQKELSTLSGIGALLGWDQMTYMPSKGTAERAEQSSLISRLAHERVISDKLWNHVQSLSCPTVFKKLKEKDQIVVKRLEKDLEKARKVPTDFVEELAKTTTIAYMAWEKARKENNFKVFSSHLEKIVKLEKKYCEYMGLPGHPYNSLLDDYEEGMTVDKLKVAFSYLKPQLVELLNKIEDSDRFKKQQDLDIKFNHDKQEKLSRFLVKKMLLPADKTRLDVSTHPFTTAMGNDDVRITTNFGRERPLFAFFSTIHEAGHALYELGLPKEEYKDTVINDSPSLGLHESQSRFWENMIARNPSFWKYLYPKFTEIFPKQFKHIDFDAWYFYVNQVKPSLIRVEADELTYCLHVILRFELEMALIDGKIAVSDLPEKWNEKMEKLLGITPTDDNEGVLQDMHWSGGSFGYFPTYAIGTIYASQLFRKLSQENPSFTNEIEQGNFNNILNWLCEHVHKYGRLMTADEIIQQACGEGLNPKVFVSYLKEKYLPLYEA